MFQNANIKCNYNLWPSQTQLTQWTRQTQLTQWTRQTHNNLFEENSLGSSWRLDGACVRVQGIGCFGSNMFTVIDRAIEDGSDFFSRFLSAMSRPRSPGCMRGPSPIGINTQVNRFADSTSGLSSPSPATLDTMSSVREEFGDKIKLKRQNQ